MSVKLIYQDIAVGAEDDAAVSTTAAQSFSDPSQLPHGAEMPLLATLEQNAWILNGTRSVRQNEKVGFWSRTMSGPDGAFASPPVITVDFDRQYTSLGITMTFDTASGDYCSSVTAQWYQGDQLLSETTFYPTGPEAFCENTVEHYNKVVLRFNSTSLPYRYAKVSYILFGIIREFGRDELRSVKITEGVNLISADLSVNKMNFTLDSKSIVEYIFQRLQPIYTYDGETLIGVFYVDGASRKARGLYDVSSSDAIGVLDQDTIPAAMYSKKSLRAILTELFGDDFDLELDPELEDETVTGYIPEGTRRNALRHITFAARCVADTSGTEAIRVFRPPTSDPAEIPPERTYTGASVSTASIVTAVKVTAHSYSTSGSGTSVRVGSTTYYDTQTVTTISNPDVTANAKPNVIEIKDATLVNPSNVTAVARAVYDYYLRRNTHKVKIVMNGERPGDYVTTTTPWGDQITGSVTSMGITLSGIAAADSEVIGI